MAVRSDKMLYISVSNLSRITSPEACSSRQGSPPRSGPARKEKPPDPAHCPQHRLVAAPLISELHRDAGLFGEQWSDGSPGLVVLWARPEAGGQGLDRMGSWRGGREPRPGRRPGRAERPQRRLEGTSGFQFCLGPFPDAYPLPAPSQRITQWECSPGPTHFFSASRDSCSHLQSLYFTSSPAPLPILGHLLGARETEMAPNSLP